MSWRRGSHAQDLRDQVLAATFGEPEQDGRRKSGIAGQMVLGRAVRLPSPTGSRRGGRKRAFTIPC